MKFVQWTIVGIGVLAVFALGLWLGTRGLTAPEPAPQAGIPLQSSSAPPVGGQPPPIGQAIPTPAVSGQSQVPMPPVRSVDVAPEAAAVKGDPEAPVTIVEYSDYQ